MNSLSKVFGESFISNDHFLTTTGAISGIMNGVGRLVWGSLSDVLGEWMLLNVGLEQPKNEMGGRLKLMARSLFISYTRHK